MGSIEAPDVEALNAQLAEQTAVLHTISRQLDEVLRRLAPLAQAPQSAPAPQLPRSAPRPAAAGSPVPQDPHHPVRGVPAPGGPGRIGGSR